MILVAMPWSFPERPSAALASLAPYVRRERPDHRVRCHSAYLEVAAAIGVDFYRRIAEGAYRFGEVAYQPLLYPERRGAVVSALGERGDFPLRSPEDSPGASFDALLEALDGHLDALVEKLAGADVVGLTTCFGQLFANLVLARRLRSRSPGTTIVLGGSTVSGRVGPALLEEYPFLDYVVQGEGERPFVGLLDVLAEGTPDRPVPGVVGRGSPGELAPAVLTELASMDELPLPDFDEFAALADEHGVDWSLAVEGSRGCWWDRTKRSGDPAATCYFCNLNLQWNGYREKSVTRLVSELATLSERYGVLDVFFLDNIIRHKGTAELARSIQGLGRDFRLFYELRANVSQHELALLWEAGLREAQFGIEGLSTAYLRRIGKGTTVLQNLSAMKTCEELEIANVANLITHFPGATEAEVDETVDVIRRFAVAFRPLDTVRLGLGVESTIEVLRDRFGIRNVRNSDVLAPGLPDDVRARIHLMELSFDCDTISPTWSRVEEACSAWRARYRSGSPRMLTYQDGGTFLRITDLRGESSSVGVVRGLERDVYLHCCDVRSARALELRFPRAKPGEIQEILAAFLAEDLMYEEGGRYLSLAMAHDARTAARRIFAQAAEPPPRRALQTLGAPA